jgi:hypothetical protein
MWILNQSKNVLTNGKIEFFYEGLTIGRGYGIYMREEFKFSHARLLGDYATLEDAKKAFDELVKKVNLYDCVIKIG